ncbi:aldo-keto reductase family 1 member E1 [Pseudomassariella vexata]|uniref:Aldo-keto reductase family 1 member E1 n=1 Tax=Pseudomassariella vexata TaxID=1141098 RepID=A0A1Y2E4B8_9PEZI|nr:aldo-keto reductase family 1 member E1 [Pseudomassariella vexata]ORY66194.1 aldo-keto reductase family 1 member E1 [Pseudomassariella vexata]
MSSNTFSLASKVKLPSGHTIPQLQLGLYMMSGREVLSSIPQALSAGYRGFDSAQMYHNECEAGQAIRDWLSSPSSNTTGLKREDVFYTSKLASCSTNYQVVRRSIKSSLEACGLGYIDLFLLHSPYGGREARLASWRAVEDAIEEGEVRSGGVSNFGSRHIDELMGSNPRIKPSVNQIEVHPFNTQEGIRETCKKHGIVVEAYGPLARAMRMNDPTILALAKKYECTPAQLMVRWSLQHGLIPLPKSVKKARLIDNVKVAHFEISAEDVAKMDGLDEHLVTDWDPTDAP